MINRNLDIFKSNLTSLKNASHDKNKNEYMTHSCIEVINFDKVKEQYIKNLYLKEPPSSNDCLVFNNKNKKWLFIEFKNGQINKIVQAELKKKIYDSLLILFDILQKDNANISASRIYIDYILVYNDKANINSKDPILIQKRLSDPANVEYSNSFINLAKSIAKTTKSEHLICFKLSSFKNFCFNDVYTFNQKEFEEYIKNQFS
ncbi:hypothetical protein [uncultured Succinatimonas sp.]|uniref:hypothetical protein n=1 Tax=uncultured Succinatimonas sp. TaxID=1262973 RepID=UPI0025CEB5DC|nr:hypothetical protein [uncultured Succinatimonas sp.]